PIPLRGQGCPQKWVPNDGKCNSWSLPQSVAFTAFTDVARGDLGCRFADINGDGRPDIICATFNGSNPTPIAQAYTNNGHGWDKVPNYELPAAFVFDTGSGPTLNVGTQLIDLDGDRLPALIAAYRNPLNPAQVWNGIFKNQGGTFDAT